MLLGGTRYSAGEETKGTGFVQLQFTFVRRLYSILIAVILLLTWLGSRQPFRSSSRSSSLSVRRNLPMMEHLPKTPESTSHVLLLSSRLHFWGIYDTIEFPEYAGFNPSVLALPSHTASEHANLVVIAREQFRRETINGNEVQPRAIVGGILRVEEKGSAMRGRWDPRNYPRTRSEWKVERLNRLIRSDDVRFPKCEPDPDDWFWNNQGPEDGRVFWSHLGEPLVIYHSISPTNSDLCRLMYLVDLRSVYTLFSEIVLRTVDPPPIRFTESVPLLIAGQNGMHKNWAPFTDSSGDVLIHVYLVPQTIYKLKSNSGTPSGSLPTFSSPASELAILEPFVMQEPDEWNCITAALNGSDVHQSSPFLELILCTFADAHSGACNPNDPKNRMYIGIFHVMHPEDRSFYEPRLLTFESSYPYRYISLSKPLVYGMTLLPLKSSNVLIAFFSGNAAEG